MCPKPEVLYESPLHEMASVDTNGFVSPYLHRSSLDLALKEDTWVTWLHLQSIWREFQLVCSCYLSKTG